VDARFDENEAELRVLVLAVGIEVFADRNGFFNEVPKVFWDFGAETLSLEDTEDLVTGHEADLRDAVRVTEGDAYLGWREAFPSEL